ncbi:TPA: glycosyl transferase [Vibrio metschnikovii]
MIIVLISTMYHRLLEINANQFLQDDEIYYIISCQGTPEFDFDVYKNKINDIFGNINISYSFIEGYGLSKNRNTAIDKLLELDIDSEYLYIADDDIVLCLDGIKHAVKFASENHLDMVAGKIATLDMTDHKENYSSMSFPLTKFNATRVSSVEMILSLATVKKYKLRFDEKFGLGSQYPSGEEYIFTSDLLSHGCKAYFYPVYLCKHPPVTSGHDFYSTPEKIMAKGAMFRRVFGIFGTAIICTVFTFKKYPLFYKNINVAHFYCNIMKGAFSYKIKG